MTVKSARKLGKRSSSTGRRHTVRTRIARRTRLVPPALLAAHHMPMNGTHSAGAKSAQYTKKTGALTVQRGSSTIFHVTVASQRETDVEDHGNARKHPLRGGVLRAKLRREHKVRATHACAIGRANVDALLGVRRRASLAVDDGHAAEHLLRLRLLHTVPVLVPTGTLQVHSVDVGALTGRSVDRGA